MQVVGSTFSSIVNNETQDVFLKFYAPWCGHCQALAPTWEELGEELSEKNNEGITVAKIDATANDYPERIFKVEAFPALYLVPRGDKERPIKYEGERELPNMLGWLMHARDPEKRAEMLGQVPVAS